MSQIEDEIKLISQSPFFDALWYEDEYGVSADEAAHHYLTEGYKLGYSPSVLFSPSLFERNFGKIEGCPLVAYLTTPRYFISRVRLKERVNEIAIKQSLGIELYPSERILLVESVGSERYKRSVDIAAIEPRMLNEKYLYLKCHYELPLPFKDPQKFALARALANAALMPQVLQEVYGLSEREVPRVVATYSSLYDVHLNNLPHYFVLRAVGRPQRSVHIKSRDDLSQFKLQSILISLFNWARTKTPSDFNLLQPSNIGQIVVLDYPFDQALVDEKYQTLKQDKDTESSRSSLLGNISEIIDNDHGLQIEGEDNLRSNIEDVTAAPDATVEEEVVDRDMLALQARESLERFDFTVLASRGEILFGIMYSLNGAVTMFDENFTAYPTVMHRYAKACPFDLSLSRDKFNPRMMEIAKKISLDFPLVRVSFSMNDHSFITSEVTVMPDLFDYSFGGGYNSRFALKINTEDLF